MRFSSSSSSSLVVKGENDRTPGRSARMSRSRSHLRRRCGCEADVVRSALCRGAIAPEYIETGLSAHCFCSPVRLCNCFLIYYTPSFPHPRKGGSTNRGKVLDCTRAHKGQIFGPDSRALKPPANAATAQEDDFPNTNVRHATFDGHRHLVRSRVSTTRAHKFAMDSNS